MTTARVATALMLALTATVPLGAQAPTPTSLTVYNDGRVLMRRSVAVRVPKGSSTQRVVLGALDPATIFSLDSAVTITGLTYDGAVDEASVLRRSVGRRVVFRLPETHDTLSALVLGVDPLRLQLPDGRVSFTAPGAALYPADVVVAEPAVTLGLESAKALDRLRLGYFTAGAMWHASYQVLLGPGHAAGRGERRERHQARVAGVPGAGRLELPARGAADRHPRAVVGRRAGTGVRRGRLGAAPRLAGRLRRRRRPLDVAALTLTLGQILGPDRSPTPRRTVGTIIAGSFVVLVILNFAWFWPIWTNGLLTRSEWFDRIWFSRWV